MQTATIWMHLSAPPNQSNIKLTNVTPAEAVIQRRRFGIKVMGSKDLVSPFTHVKIDKDEATTGGKLRTAEQEYRRLCGKFGEAEVQKSFPGDGYTIPTEFSAVGISETKQAEPDAGEHHAIEPLTEIHDAGEDMTLGDKSDELTITAKAQAQTQAATEVAELKGQIAALTALVGQLAQGQQSTSSAPSVPTAQQAEPEIHA